jgi:hypothetical protein
MNPRDWFLVAEAWAAGGGEHHAPEISGIIFPLLNFLIYAGIIYYFAFPLIRSFLTARPDGFWPQTRTRRHGSGAPKL